MGGGKGAESESAADLNEIAKQFFGETTPLRQELNRQLLEALTTGGVGARIPIIGKAQEASQQATSRALGGVDERLASMRLSGTPFGEMIRAGTLQQGQYATSQVPIDMILGMLTGIPGYVTGANQVTVSGLGQSASAQAQQTGAFGNLIGGMASPFRFNF